MPTVEPDTTMLPDALMIGGSLPKVVKATSSTRMLRRRASSGRRGRLPVHRTPAGIDASKRPETRRPALTCSITQRRAPVAISGIHICFSAPTLIGENVAAMASDGVTPLKPRLPAAAIAASCAWITAFSMLRTLAFRSATPETAMRWAIIGGSPESLGARIAPGDSNSKP